MAFSYLYILAAFLITVGLTGLICNRRSLIHVLMAIEVMLLGVSLNFITMSVERGDITGQIVVLFILAVAAAEAAMGLALLVAYSQVQPSLLIDDVCQLQDKES